MDHNASSLLDWPKLTPQLERYRPFSLSMAATANEVIHRENKLKLRHYFADTPRTKPPVLVVPSLINKYYILDLLPNYSFVEFLVEQGHDVFLIDWGEPTDEDRFINLETIVFRYLKRCFNIVRKRTQQDVSLIGYCLGGNLANLFAADGPQGLGALVNLTTPINFHNDGLLSHWTRVENFDIDQLVEATGNVPWYLMQSSFQMLSPLGSLGKVKKLFSELGNDQFLDRFFALEAWGNDNVSFPGEAFRELIDLFYKQNVFVLSDAFEVGTRELSIRNISVPMLNIFSETDGIVPAESAKALKGLCSESQYTEFIAKGGHIGAIVGGRAKSEMWPFLSAWICGNQTEV